jgi:hypothetical protein
MRVRSSNSDLSLIYYKAIDGGKKSACLADEVVDVFLWLLGIHARLKNYIS